MMGSPFACEWTRNSDPEKLMKSKHIHECFEVKVQRFAPLVREEGWNSNFEVPG